MKNNSWVGVIAVHDEIEIPPGELRVKLGGGSAGHNGLKSLTQALGTPEYHRVRRAAALTYVAVEPVFLFFPTAPPRVLDGFVDTISEVSGVDIEHPLLVRFYNPIAAMPSLHVAFAVLTGAAIAEQTDSMLGKGAAYAYAPLVALVVAGTGNHYVLDALAGAALGVAARSVA